MMYLLPMLDQKILEIKAKAVSILCPLHYVAHSRCSINVSVKINANHNSYYLIERKYFNIQINKANIY